MLKCSFCKNVKTESEFYQQPASTRGYSYGCRECERRRKRLPPDKLKRRPNGSVPRNKSEYFKTYYLNNRDRRLKNRRLYYLTAKGSLSAKTSEHKRRLLEKSQEGSISVSDIQTLLNLQDNRCAKCLKEFNGTLKYTIDHIIPLSKGGGLRLENVQLLCKSCNCSKGAKTIQYRKELVYDFHGG